MNNIIQINRKFLNNKKIKNRWSKISMKSHRKTKTKKKQKVIKENPIVKFL